ncbi:MAG: hypothetical protein JSU01_20190, partial [Bacteroidetes bacterium]|nr:hypothetical protein [Bacteroidota bacterium]
GGTYLWNPLFGVDANDIGIGANGAVFVTGKDDPSSASYQPPVYNFNNNQWNMVPQASGVSISVDPSGNAYYIDKAGVLHKP